MFRSREDRAGDMATALGGQGSRGRENSGPRLHVMLTVNAAWNIWNFRRHLVTALLEDGHKVSVLAPADGSEKDLQAMGCTFIPLSMHPGGLNPLSDLKLLRRIYSVLAHERPDAVLGFTIKPNLYGAMAAKRLGIPFVPTITGLGTAFLSGGTLQRVAEALYRRAFGSLPIVMFQNEDDSELFVERLLVQRRQARVVPGSGIDIDHFAPADFPQEDKPVTFLMIARLLSDKGVLEYAEAARIVRAAYPDARFQLLGAADAANRTAISLATVRAWQSSHGIQYVGPADDVRSHIAAAHCVVLPSYREGAPRTLIEAAAMARPLIATDVPGCRAVINPEVNGLLCAPRDAGDLAGACKRFLALPRNQHIEMGAAGRSKIEREFAQDIVVAVYRQALGEVCPAAVAGFGASPSERGVNDEVAP